jgi:predicted small secreted protein
MIKTIVVLITSLFLTACSPSIGIGLGGSTISGNLITTSEVHMNSDTGVHGSVGVGTDISL